MSWKHLQHFMFKNRDAGNLAATYRRHSGRSLTVYWTQHTRGKGEPYTAALYLSLLYFKKFREMPPLVLVNYACPLDKVLMKLNVESFTATKGSPRVDPYPYETEALKPTQWTANDLHPFSTHVSYGDGKFQVSLPDVHLDDAKDLDLARIGLDPAYKNVPRLYLMAAQHLATNRIVGTTSLPRGKQVGTLLVARSGEVLAWGVNTNTAQEGYRHAEVNMFMSFWSRTKQPIPDHALIFTTLQCCTQCCAMIDLSCESSKGVEEWYNMADTGSFGSAIPAHASLFCLGDLDTKTLQLVNERTKEKIKGTDLGDTMTNQKQGAAATWVGQGGAKYTQMAQEQLALKFKKYQGEVTSKNPESRVREVLRSRIEPFLNYVGVRFSDLEKFLPPPPQPKPTVQPTTKGRKWTPKVKN